MVAAAAAAFCVALFWFLALAINRLVPNSAIDPEAGVVAGVLVAIPVYRRCVEAHSRWPAGTGLAGHADRHPMRLLRIPEAFDHFD